MRTRHLPATCRQTARSWNRVAVLQVTCDPPPVPAIARQTSFGGHSMTMNRLMNGARVALCALAFALCADARSGEPLASIMYIDVGGGLSGVTAMRMAAGVFLPEGEGPFPVLIYSHGRSGTEAERHQTRIPDIRGHVRYWLRKGFAVIAPPACRFNRRCTLNTRLSGRIW